MKFKPKKLGWIYIQTAMGNWAWWNCDTHELECNFWKGLLKKFKILK